MYNMNDYRMALSERDSCDIGTIEWNLSQMKVTGIVTAMISSGSTFHAQQMVKILGDEVYSLNDSGVEFEHEAVQFDIWLLESNGYIKEAEELKTLGRD